MAKGGKKAYKDPLETQGFAAEELGTFSQKLEYDPDYGRKFYTIVYFCLALATGIVGFALEFPMLYYIAGAFLLFALFTLVFYKSWKKYDIASSRVYCEKLYPPGTSKEKIRECLFEREREERLQGGGAGSNIGTAVNLGILGFLLNN